MSPRRKIVAAAATASVLAAGLAFVAAAQAEDDGRPAAERDIDWHPCEANPEAECGSVSVPLDWSDPGGETIDLAVARMPATDPDNRVGSLLLNAGGPGTSGVEFALSQSTSITEGMRTHFDLVGFDPRGIAASRGILCDQDLAAAAKALHYPKSPEEFDDMRAANVAYGESCREQSGPVFDVLDTTATVRDMDAIRAALGEEKLNFYGLSYGSLLGQQYAEAYPENVRTLLLDSNIDHTLDPFEWLTTSAVAQENLFLEFGAWCDGETRCAVHDEGAVALWDRLYRQASDGELFDPQDPQRAVRPEELNETLQASSYKTVQWWSLAEYLDALNTGDASQAARALDELPAEPGHAEPQFFDGFWSTFCQDWDFPLGEAGYDQLESWRATLASDYAPHTKFNSLMWADITGCVDWPAEIRNPQREPQIDGVPPILLTNPVYDPGTPHEWATGLNGQIPGSALVTYDGPGHGAIRASPCVAGYAENYLVTGEVPPEGTHCPAEPVGEPA
ncbi:MAG: alpha/beta hydrolase [Stackebrandtia sp.]